MEKQGGLFQVAKSLEIMSRAAISHEATFEKFWAKYPRRDGKKPAFAKWKKLKMTKSLYTEIMTGLEAQRKLWASEGRERKHIPMPQTWIYNERWTDDVGFKLPFEAPPRQEIKVLCSVCQERESHGQLDGKETCVECWRKS